MTSKTQQKRKTTENKTWVISQEVLFFNAFQLGAESFRKSSISRWRSIKINSRGLFNNALYFIYKGLRIPSLNSLGLATFVKRIFRDNPIKILFIGFMQCYKLTRYGYLVILPIFDFI